MVETGINHDRADEIISQSIDLISKKWHSSIIFLLLRKEDMSFSQLKKDLDGISNKVLSESLNDLIEKDIVEKDENGSPVYKLTEKGSELGEVFEEIIDWGERYVVDDRTSVLIVEDNEAQAKMYKRWLEPGYDVNVATEAGDVFDAFTEDTEVVLLDRKLPESSAEEILESSSELASRQVIMITGMEPDLDLLELDIEDYLVKPVSKDNLKESVAKVVKASRKTERGKELLSLLAKKRVLDRKKSSDVRNSEKYRELVERIEELENEVDSEESFEEIEI